MILRAHERATPIGWFAYAMATNGPGPDSPRRVMDGFVATKP